MFIIYKATMFQLFVGFSVVNATLKFTLPIFDKRTNGRKVIRGQVINSVLN